MPPNDGDRAREEHAAALATAFTSQLFALGPAIASRTLATVLTAARSTFPTDDTIKSVASQSVPAAPDAFSPSALTIIANALVTGAPLNERELRHAMAHYKSVAALLQISGPRFGGACRDAADLHNRAVRRMRENAAERQVRERHAAEAAEGLVELPAP